MIYLTHPQHGAMHASSSEADNLTKLHGWTKAQEPTAAEVQAQKRGAKADALKAQLAEIEAQEKADDEQADAPKKKPRK